MRCVDDVLVGLVGDDEGIMLFGEIEDQLQLGPGEDFAGGVGGIADDDGLGPLSKGAGEFIGIKAELRRAQRDVDGLGPGEDGVCGVVFLERGEDDDFVSGLAAGHHGAHHGLGAAAGDDEVLIWIHRGAGEMGDLSGEGLAEARRAPGDGVLMERAAGGAFQCGEEFLRRIEVGKALGKIDRAMLIGEARHGANDGFGEGVEAAGSCRHPCDLGEKPPTCNQPI